MRKTLLPIAAAVALAMALPASAVTYSFSATGVGGQSASVTIDVGASFMDITLTNNTTPLTNQGAQQLLTGIEFLTTTNLEAAGQSTYQSGNLVDILSSTTTNNVADPGVDSLAWDWCNGDCAGPNPDNYLSALPGSVGGNGPDWGILNSASTSWGSSLYNNSDPLDPGAGTHNSLFFGPATFRIAGDFQNAVFDGVRFYFNTSGDITVTAVPEPSTYALMFAGLAAVGFMARRRRQA